MPDSACSLAAASSATSSILAPSLAACAPALARVGALEPQRAAAALCPATARPFSAATVAEYLVTCPPGTVAADCVPACTRDVNGDLLLRASPAPFRARARFSAAGGLRAPRPRAVNLGGHDSKMTCELHGLLFSWVRLPGFHASPYKVRST